MRNTTNANGVAILTERNTAEDNRTTTTISKNNANNNTNDLDDKRSSLHEQQLINDQQDENSDIRVDEIKCSAISTLECNIPDFDYSDLVTQLRAKLLEHHEETNRGIYSHSDIEKCKQDDWYLARFLIRNKLDVELAFQVLSKALRYNSESLCNIIRRNDFPEEFYQIGGMFTYEPDRKGNQTLYIRARIHRKIPELQAFLHAFIYSNVKLADDLAKGRGIAVVIDCSGGGLVNADMDSLFFFVQTIRLCFPKAVSYLLVHQLPWILKPFWLIAKQWIADEQAQLIKFSNSQTIFEYIEQQNLPDFMGGTCKRSYRSPPENCTTLVQAVKLWGVESQLARKIICRFIEYLPEGALERYDALKIDDSNPLNSADDIDSKTPLDSDNYLQNRENKLLD